MIVTLLLAALGPLVVSIGLLVFKNAFLTFLLFHGFVCLGIPIIDLVVLRKLKVSDIRESLGLVHHRGSLRTGVYSGIVFLVAIVVFFYILRDSVIQVGEIQSLLHSWQIQKEHIFVLLVLMILANSGLEEIYWRGYILGRFQAHLKTVPAVILSSLFYASYHLITTANLFSMQVGVLFTIVIFLAGVFWAVIRARSGSLFGSIVSHFLADAAVMIIYVAFVQQHL